MSYSIRPATIADLPHIVRHREQMFRDMGIPAAFEDMAAARGQRSGPPGGVGFFAAALVAKS